MSLKFEDRLGKKFLRKFNSNRWNLNKIIEFLSHKIKKQINLKILLIFVFLNLKFI